MKSKNTGVRKKSKTSTIDLLIPLDVVDFYARVGKHCKLSKEKVIEVVATIEAVKLIDAAKSEKKLKKGKK